MALGKDSLSNGKNESEMTDEYYTEEEVAPIDFSEPFFSEKNGDESSDAGEFESLEESKEVQKRRVSRSSGKKGAKTTGSSDPMNIYFREMGTLNLLKHEEERELARTIERGNKQIQEAVFKTRLALPLLCQLRDSVETHPVNMSVCSRRTK